MTTQTFFLVQWTNCFSSYQTMDEDVPILHMRQGHISCDLFTSRWYWVYKVLWDFTMFVSVFNKFLFKNVVPIIGSFSCWWQFLFVLVYKNIALTYTTIWHYKLPSVEAKALIYQNSSSNLFSTLELFFTSSSRTTSLAFNSLSANRLIKNISKFSSN